ncbi:hypothetical protein M9H77_32722 [Catharanthus roseus]|uniref:Uncharacterized protein n=1 Tax=Catharanthus roseus TaxID=4058 RepID=A0ACC0A5K5_CATRO|nr:hypothetical protein M9H77_32722 [Catharanthus roseus]
MVSGKTLEELPPGWKEIVRVRNGRRTRHYTNPSTGQRFYSRQSVLRFINYQRSHQGSSSSTNKPDMGSMASKSKVTPDIDQGSSPSTKKPDTGSMASKSKVTPDNDNINESPEWLPRGWTVECRARNRGFYKVYTDPYTGCKFYSKPQVMQYLQGLEDDKAKGKQLQISQETLVKQQDISQHGESVEAKIHLSGENKNDKGKSPMKDAEANNGKDELLPVNKQEINTRKRGRGTMESQQDTSQASEALERKNHMSGDNENNVNKPSLKIDFSDVQVKNGSDELPPGWIKEIKIRKSGSAVRKDPYYIDPASGYAFRSKRDVMRYLDTGDISSCVIKPAKWDLTEQKSIMVDTHLQPPHDGNISEESPTGRLGQKPENGEECPPVSSTAVLEAEKSKDKEGGSMSETSKDTDGGTPAAKLTASTIEEMSLGSGTTRDEKSGLKAEGSNQDAKIVPDNVSVKGTDTDGFHEQKLPENGLGAKTKTVTRKSKKRNLPSTPGRSSKRLAGHEPEMLPDLSLTERALRAAVRKPREVEADTSSGMTPDTSAKEVGQQHVTQAETTRLSSLASSTTANEVSQHPVTDADTVMSSLNTAANEVPQQPIIQAETTTSSLNTAANEMPQQPIIQAETTASSLNTAANEMPQQPIIQAETTAPSLNVAPNEMSQQPIIQAETTVANEAPSENQVSSQQTTGQVSERQVEENPMSQGDYWSDPCWDFAFKTLTGAIPLEDTLTLNSCFPQQTGTSYNQENLNFGLPEFEIPPIFQNDVPQPALAQNTSAPPAADQPSTAPTLAPPGNINLPGCSSQQPPSLEAQKKDYQTKVNS